VTTSPDSVKLTEIRAYLTARGMTQWYQPSRVEIISQLPRNGSGKVHKDLLRKILADKAIAN
jgi:cyclohexanecarboxylate-CoA ligase